MQAFLVKYKKIGIITIGILIAVTIVYISHFNKTTYVISLVPGTIQKLVSDLYACPDYGIQVELPIEGESIGVLKAEELADLLMETYGSWIKKRDVRGSKELPDSTFVLEAESHYILNFYEGETYVAQIIEDGQSQYYTLDEGHYKRIRSVLGVLRNYTKYLEEDTYATVIAYKDGSEIAREAHIDLARVVRDYLITGELSRKKSKDTAPSASDYLKIDFGDEENYYIYEHNENYYIEHLGNCICHIEWDVYEELNSYVGIAVKQNNQEGLNKKPFNPPKDKDNGPPELFERRGLPEMPERLGPPELLGIPEPPKPPELLGMPELPELPERIVGEDEWDELGEFEAKIN